MELGSLNKTLVEAAAKSFEASYTAAVGKYRQKVEQLQIIEHEAIVKMESCVTAYADAKSYIDLLAAVGVHVEEELIEYVPRIMLRYHAAGGDVVYNKTPTTQQGDALVDESVVNDTTSSEGHSENIKIREGLVEGDTNEDSAKPKRQRGTQDQVLVVIKEQSELLTTREIVRLINDWRPGTSYSSITNSLIRLAGELNQLRKIKDDSGANLYGAIEWFNEDGSVKPEYARREGGSVKDIKVDGVRKEEKQEISATQHEFWSKFSKYDAQNEPN